MVSKIVIAVDPRQSLEGLNVKTASLFGDILVSVNEQLLVEVLHFIESYALDNGIICEATRIDSLDQVVRLLNAGASRVVLRRSIAKKIVEEQCLEEKDYHRIIIDYSREESLSTPEALVNEVRALVAESGTGAPFARLVSGGSALLKDLIVKDAAVPVYVNVGEDILKDIAEISRYNGIAIIDGQRLTIESTRHSNLLPAHQLLLTDLRSDRSDGLFPTVVTDDSDRCLGLVYSSQESIAEAVKSGRGIYYSRSRANLWRKGEESGNTQELLSITRDCDADALQFRVRQSGSASCFGHQSGMIKLEQTLRSRKQLAPAGSYTAKLFQDQKFLQAKIMEEAHELCEASSKNDVAAEMADLIYFAMTKCVSANVSLKDVERNLDRKALRVTRRKGDTKPKWADSVNGTSQVDGKVENGSSGGASKASTGSATSTQGIVNGNSVREPDTIIQMKRHETADTSQEEVIRLMERPSQRTTDSIMNIVQPIISEVRLKGDAALLAFTHKFEKATSLTSPILKAPYSADLMQLSSATIKAIDTSFENIRRFHEAQRDKPLVVETMPGVTCSRFSRPIERVGLYVPGGTAVLPSTALMLGVPAMVAGCRNIVLASPPRSDGTISPEIVYIAHKVGADCIVLAGGAQAVAAMAYGTESVPKVDKILGPGNQFVTAAKMIVSNDTTASVSIDMPAGPSEVMVIADETANPAFVASDLLSQAEHGADSQVVLIAINLTAQELHAIDSELHKQAITLPRVDIVRKAIDHSVTLVARDIDEAMRLCNLYAPEHLILQLANAEQVVDMVMNAGSIFIGPWTPESVGDYSAGVNHSLPTYGYAKQYSGVNLSSFTKHITSSKLTRGGLESIGNAVMQLASVEALEAHRRAVEIRLNYGGL